MTTCRCLAMACLVMLATLVAPVGADALTDSTLFCELTGGNSIVLTLRLTQQGDFFAAVGQWDDASLSPFVPVYGAVVEDPNFGIVGGLTRVGFSGRPMRSAPFGTRPLAFHVQFRLNETREGLSGKWADDRKHGGDMTCSVVE